MQIIVAKFRLKLRKVGETTKPFTIQARGKSNPLRLQSRSDKYIQGIRSIGRVSEKLCIEVHNIVQEVVTKAIPKKKKCKRATWLSEEVLHIAEERREVKGKGERERYSS